VYCSGQKGCLWAIPIYWLVQNLINCFTYVFEICRLIKNILEKMLSIFVSLVHLWILGKFLTSSLRCVLVVCFFK
jgi:hypothetical protein